MLIGHATIHIVAAFTGLGSHRVSEVFDAGGRHGRREAGQAVADLVNSDRHHCGKMLSVRGQPIESQRAYGSK